jgi:hypothetical protein
MVGSGVLRYDHDPVTRQPLGVRIEGAATNLLTYSECPNGTADLLSGGQVTAVADIEGGRTGLRLNNTTANAWAYKANPLATGTQAVLSVFVEMEDGEPPVFGGGAVSGLNTFALVAGGPTLVPTVIERVSTKVWRCGWSGATGGTGGVGVFQATTNQQRRFKVTGFQLEAGAVASSYIVTGASAVTRASERLYLDLPFDPAEEGVTLLWDGVLPASSASIPVALTLVPPTGPIDRVQLYATSTLFGIVGENAASGFWAPTPGWRTFAAGARRRVVARLTPAALSLSQNGDAVTTAALTGAIPDGMTRLHVGSLAGSNPWGSTISRVAIWKGAPLSDAQMRELSAL